MIRLSNPSKLFSSAYLAALLLLPPQILASTKPSLATSKVATHSTKSTFPMTITHKLGKAVIKHVPKRAVALDMNEVDILDRLGVPVAGMPKDFVPHFLMKYKTDQNVADVGSIVQPNLERVHAAKPDLILISPLQANHYKDLAELAPTIHLDVDYKTSASAHFDIVTQHLKALGAAFDRADHANAIATAFSKKVTDAQRLIQNRPEKAMVVLHNNGAYRYFGDKSRYGFVYRALGVKAAGSSPSVSLHGHAISNEFIAENDPDIIYVVDRTAVMEGRPRLDRKTMANPIIKQTKAWKNNRIVFVDPDAWYTTGAGISSLEIVIADVLSAYQK